MRFLLNRLFKRVRVVRFETVILPQSEPLPCWARAYVRLIDLLLSIPQPVGPVSFVTTLVISVFSNSGKFLACSTRGGRTPPASR